MPRWLWDEPPPLAIACSFLAPLALSSTRGRTGTREAGASARGSWSIHVPLKTNVAIREARDSAFGAVANWLQKVPSAPSPVNSGSEGAPEVGAVPEEARPEGAATIPEGPEA